jgi:hypothetical protein
MFCTCTKEARGMLAERSMKSKKRLHWNRLAASAATLSSLDTKTSWISNENRHCSSCSWLRRKAMVGYDERPFFVAATKAWLSHRDMKRFPATSVGCSWQIHHERWVLVADPP